MFISMYECISIVLTHFHYRCLFLFLVLFLFLFLIISIHIIIYFSVYDFHVVFIYLYFYCSASLSYLMTKRYSILSCCSHDIECIYHTLSTSFSYLRTLSPNPSFLPFLLPSFLHFQGNYYLTFSQNTILPQKTDLVHFPELPQQPAIMCVGAC